MAVKERNMFEDDVRSDFMERPAKRKRCEESDSRERLSKRVRGCEEREREREASRKKMEKMENSAGIEINVDSFRELERLSGCCLTSQVFLGRQGKADQVVSGVFNSNRGFWNPLEKLGLRIKDDDEDMITEELKEGDTTPSSSIGNRADSLDQVKEKANLDDKTLRVAMLKCRYANIIAKAQQKTLFV